MEVSVTAILSNLDCFDEEMIDDMSVEYFAKWLRALADEVSWLAVTLSKTRVAFEDTVDTIKRFKEVLERLLDEANELQDTDGTAE